MAVSRARQTDSLTCFVEKRLSAGMVRWRPKQMNVFCEQNRVRIEGFIFSQNTFLSITALFHNFNHSNFVHKQNIIETIGLSN